MTEMAEMEVSLPEEMANPQDMATVKDDKRGACKQKAATVLPNRTAAT